MDETDMRDRKAGRYAKLSMGILLCAVIFSVLLFQIGGTSELRGFLYLFFLIVCPLISLVCGILAVHTKVTFLTVASLVFSIAVIVMEITIVYVTIWMIRSACDALSGPGGEEIWEMIRGCGEIG